MIYDYNENKKIFADYAEGRSWLDGISVEIVGGENELDARTLLKAQEATADVDNISAIACGFIRDKEIRFIDKNKKIIHSFIYHGGALEDKFVGKPYLMDLLLKVSFGLMIKKLTPPSDVSEI